MQRLEVSGAVRHLYGWLGVKGLRDKTYSDKTKRRVGRDSSVGTATR
jgi:hypothetical protein